MTMRKRGINSLTAALLAACLAVSCATPQPPPPVYGEPGPHTIRVYIGGAVAVHQGLYYFNSGTTLETALTISGNSEQNQFANRMVLYNRNRPTGIEKKGAYQVRKLTALEKAEVLHDGDYLQFPCDFP
jgi:hypothetical protein